ncbi:MAG: lipopolysaccharide kinase InaA family protein [Candidatus Pelagadaptatus aseana]|uniref:lipopolysaccharide kinase InaA family protein n=1 Tax=Candidatus Pelagadaptatus aseana TaxID=3120508 RepID=UPI0039B2E915
MLKTGWDKLAEGERQPQLPLQLEAPQLQLQQWLRVLPGKRYVAKALLNDSLVLVKLFLGGRAQKKVEAEIAGSQALAERNLPTPELLASGVSGNRGWVVYQWLDQAITLQQLAGISVEGLSSKHQRCPESVLQVAELIARMHDGGLIQQDLHPGNFIFASGQWWVVDAADVVLSAEAEAKKQNLAVFLAQIPPVWVSDVLNKLESSESDHDDVVAMAHKWRAWRALDLARKSLRDCTLFQVNQTVRGFSSGWRDGVAIPSDWDTLLEQGERLKDGGSATVGLIEYGQQKLVLKRYNLKNWRHWLKRFWRPTRAWHSWFVGHRLRVLGVPTPKPLVMAEERFGPLRGRGFLLSQQAPGDDILVACKDAESTRAVAADIAAMLKIFIREKISHGDFKGTNLLWDGQLHLIDLDAVQWHRDHGKWRKAFGKDISRLLRNWPEGSEQHRVMSEMIKELHF